jgi:probable F420-dependent oxidoreductase
MSGSLSVGIHLPQFGRAATEGSVEGAAQQAERLGFADVWVSDHLVVPAGQSYPGPYILDPLMALAFAAAATTRVGLGTSVLVAPQYASPLALANSLASLDAMSGGRLTLGMGIGWAAAEFQALGVPFAHRAPRLVEMIEILRAAWTTDPTEHVGTHYGSFTRVRVLPKPAHPIPVWLGGREPAAVERACRIGEGYHGIRISPDQAVEFVGRVRELRPEPAFTISLRITWDVEALDRDRMAEEVARYEAAGVQHLVITPRGGHPAQWRDQVEAVASAVGPWLAPISRPAARPGADIWEAA